MKDETFPARKKGLCRFAGAAAAASALAAIGGLAPASAVASPRTSAPAAAVAPPRSSVCHWFPMPSRFWITDPTNRNANVWGNYNRPGSKGVAYKLTGQFTHSTTMSFTTYNNLVDINSPAYALSDSNIIPDPGSVNPFVPGTRVQGKPRNYTVWVWPDSIRVPTGLKNVVLYPTKPEDPGGTPFWSMAMRMYHMQPGYRAISERPTITAVSAANPGKPVRCPLTVAGTIANQAASFFHHIAKYGSLEAPPEPTTGDKIYYTRYPGAFGVGLDGYPGPLPLGCAAYFVATVPLNEVSVTTMHQVPPYFNNDLVTSATIMKDYPIRYQSLLVSYFTTNGRLYRSLAVNTDDALYTPDGSWVTVFLPSEPRLTPAQDKLVRAVAALLNYNVIQLPPTATGPIAKQIPSGLIAVRQKAVSSSFPYSNLNTPCWSDTHNYKTYSHQTSPAFFANYASSPRYNGPYYIDGYKLTFAQFMAKFSKK